MDYMKKFGKIITWAVSAAMLITAFAGLNVHAASEVTGAQLKALAESRTLDQSPYVNEILDAEYYGEDYSFSVGKDQEKIGDYIDSSKAYMSCNETYLTQFFKPDKGGAKSFSEAHALRNAETGQYIYYMPTEGYDERGNRKAYSVEVYINKSDGEKHVYAYLYKDSQIPDYSKEYDKVAGLINENDLGTPSEVLLFDYDNTMGITTPKGNYMVLFNEWVNDFAAYLGKETVKLSPYTMYTVEEYNEFYDGYHEDQENARKLFYERLREAAPEFKTYDQVREAQNNVAQTDSFSKYIGSAPQYSDITEAQAAVTNQLTDLGVITGSDGMFYPDKQVTRAEASAMLCRLFMVEPTDSRDFPDVAASHWAAKYIGALSSEGVINGFEDGTFRPEETVTYEQVFKMVESLLGHSSDGEYNPTEILMTASQLGLTDDLGSFNSGDPITRIELACILSRTLDSHMVGIEYYIDPFGLKFYIMNDITLSDYRNGKEPVGELLRFGYTEHEKEVEQEFAEKCGAIVDEFNQKAGLDQAKNVSGGIGAAKTSTSSTPRITSY